ncbi:U3 small nucleolar RNA-associated protein 15 homolog [Gigantopelta aegis]|uniref:U3 small nucleolar RNA-associated protein 15 homolog n=1 Tax=Gigantopelta aegis TaxID=1735272 RepID=UPI001B88A12A|nr:U3 small nucleolar RNA-associated protein 15 homolog [Gigantopelta aegis]
MASSYKKTVIKSYVQIGEKTTPDNLYWKNLEVPITKKEYGAITHVEFCPVDPYNYAVTNSTRVQIYSSRTNQILRTISRFREVAHSGSFRSDGQLLVAGGDEGSAKLFDVKSKSLLRVFKGHDGPVNVTRFLSDRLRIMTGSNDRSVRVWDIPTEKAQVIYDEHEDYVRCGAVSQASPDIFVTGSYDHTVKMFDARMSESVMMVDHGQPVDDVIMFPHGSVFLTAGGNVVKVWDVLSGGRLLTTLCHHHKNVTALTFCSNYQRFMSASLDRHVKIYDVTSYQVVHTLDYPGAILSLGVSPDDSLLVVGMADGLLSIQRRKTDDTKPKIKPKKKPSFRYVTTGKTYTPHSGDHVIGHRRKEQLAKYDKYFKSFQHSKALDAALEMKVQLTHPEVTVSVIQELIRRGSIKNALAGRTDKSLRLIIKFIHRLITNTRFRQTLTDVTNLLLDLYSQRIMESGVQTCTLTESWARLRHLETVDYEVAYMKQLMEVMGFMDILFSASSQTLFMHSSDTDLNNELNTPPPTVQHT